MSNFFVVYQDRIKKNIDRLTQKAHANNIAFRPHFKTHQNIEVASFFRKAGVESITVSSVKMANFFAQNGWNDIFIAFPIDLNEIEEIDSLAKNIILCVLINNIAHLKALEKLKNKVAFMIEIDAGYHRSGVDFDNQSTIFQLINHGEKMENAEFKGIMAHFGNSYTARNAKEIVEIGMQSIDRLVGLKEKIKAETGKNIFISIGDTPTASVMNQFPKIDEIRPGNFVYYDLMQLQIESCNLSEIGALMRCSVVSKNEEKQQLIIHGGAVHFSKEYIDYMGVKTYGNLIEFKNDEWILRLSYLSSLSQEHGILQCNKEDFNKYEIGDYVHIIPVHSCLTADLMKENTIFI